MWNPVECEWELFRQRGPLYGENSAPKRWEDTYAPYLESEGFERGLNDPSIFYHPVQDVLNLTYVDDNFLDGEEQNILWATNTITDRFDCKELVFVSTDGTPADHLGMMLSIDAERTYLEMVRYIDNALEILEWTDLKPAPRPIRASIDIESNALTAEESAKFQTP